jgi:eukaryotic-like serine/threonine-protein kinase
MSLSTGTRLGPYEIVSPLGAGGMGEVYRARDTRLGRDVAIKVLPASLSNNPELRARFEREAKTVSSLNHPHICVVHDVGRAPGEAGAGDTDYLVMELVEGDTLAARLAKGALPPADVLKLGAQIADALDRAHRAGVVHRDLKPGNVMLARAGAKLMDFGLARPTPLGGPSSSVTAAMTQSPTVAAPLTAEGTIVGTFQYMAPEQLEGKESDARSDIWSLGCVLYEMATGKRAFEGSTQASLISAIMRDTPRAMTELQPLTPPALERLVATCLAKDPADRIQSAHDVKLQLEWIGSAGSHSAVSLPAGRATSRRAGRREVVAWTAAVFALAIAAAAWLLFLGMGRKDADSMMRFTIVGPPANALSPITAEAAISPDGRAVAFLAADSSGVSRLWLRELVTVKARALPGTENATLPFWAPDSRALGYFADGKLRKVELASGRSEVLCDAADPRGGTWGVRGVIVFAPIAAGPLYSIPADGGTPEVVLRPDSTRKETSLRSPEFLPDGRRFLFVALPRRDAELEAFVGELGTGKRQSIGMWDTAPVYAEPGFLIMTRKGNLIAHGFDPKSTKLQGKPVTLAETPLVFGNDGTRAVSVSRTGILVHTSLEQSNTKLVWFDRNGRQTSSIPMAPGRYDELSIAPDGKRAIALRRTLPSEPDLWLVDLAHGVSTRLAILTSPSLGNVTWSPDGSSIAYHANRFGPADLFMTRVDTPAEETLLESDVIFKNPSDWTRGGFVVFEQPDPVTGWDVWHVPVAGNRTPTPLARTTANEGGGWVSPDSKWIVYSSDETGRIEFYLQSYPDGGSRQRLGAINNWPSTSSVHWSADGRELLVEGTDYVVRAIEIEPGPTLRVVNSRTLFRPHPSVVYMCAAPDHQRFLASVTESEAPPPALTVMLNWRSAMEGRR